MAENNHTIIKYDQEDIERIFLERVSYCFHMPKLKAGVICEWALKYPNGATTVQVDYSFPIDPANADVEIGKRLTLEKVKNHLWQICGQYSLSTGKKL